MISVFLIFNLKGEVLVSRLFRDNLRRSIADVFRIQVITNPDVRSPILTLGSTSFCHIKHDNLYIVAITRYNTDAALIFELLYKFVDTATQYLHKLDEEAVKANFTLIYELLDEMIDFGYPQSTDPETLRPYVTTEGIKMNDRSITQSSQITRQATSATPWRGPGIKHRKNEAFVDVVEDVDVLMSASGSVLQQKVAGHIKMKAQLSGMPECKFGLNDTLTLEDDRGEQTSWREASPGATSSIRLESCSFHQCVRLGRFDADRIITFVPPDGEFELMSYNASSGDNLQLPFKVVPLVTDIGTSKMEYQIMIRALFPSKLEATDLIIKVPTPPNTIKVNPSIALGKAKYNPGENCIIWRIAKFSGGSEQMLTAEVNLSQTTIQQMWSRPPIRMNFNILMFTCSGIVVRYLRVYEPNSKYKTIKWVRYLVRAGDYEIRF